MPDLPLRERVLAAIADRVGSIVEGDEYFSTVARVSRVMMDPNRAMEYTPTVFVTTPGETASELTGAMSATGLSVILMDVLVSVYWLEDDASDTTANCLAHDIQKAVCSDRSNSSTSINMSYLGMTIASNEAIAPYAHIALRFQVHFRHEFANPSQKR